MTQEDKAKAYDEALERMKSWARGEHPECFTEAQKAAEFIFPELAESEDEKIRKELIDAVQGLWDNDALPMPLSAKRKDAWLAWLEKQGEQIVYCPQNHQDMNHPNGGIVMEDFNGGEGFYKLNLDYLNKKQVEEIEEIVKTWNTKPNDDIIKECIEMALTDVPQSRFESYGTNLKDCLTWLEKQEMYYTKKDVDDAYLKGITDTKNEIEKQYEADYQIRKDIATFIFYYKGDIKDRAKWMDYLGFKVSFVKQQGEKPQGKSALEAAKEEKVDNSNSVNNTPYDYENTNINQKDFAPKQELSKEEQDILDDIEEAVINYWHGDTLNTIISWLDSIKERINNGNTSFQS